MKYFYNLGSFFDAIAAANSDRCAIRTAQRDYTYGELAAGGERLAAQLKGAGIDQGDVVAIASTKAFEDYALMMACLKIGVTYVNLDTDNPGERIRHVLDVCRPKAVFGKASCKHVDEICRALAIPQFGYDMEAKGPAVERDIDGETVAYIMFTSGSTGVPKGAAITHQNLMHFINWATRRCRVSPSDNFANISPMYFDNSVFDFYTALFSGACLTPVTKELLGKPLELLDYVESKGCTIWFSVPSMLMYLMTMKVLTAGRLAGIRLFVFGGEGYPKTELKKLYDLYGARSEFLNVYGPTECTCMCSAYTVTSENFRTMDELTPLGPINPNFSYVVLNEAAESSEGELCLLGPNVGKGYYRNPDATASAFSCHTDRNHYRKAMYKTGDLVRDVDGILYFKGRADNQIKHMGYRIELEEIELALSVAPGVGQAAVVYQQTTPMYGHIVAFLSPAVREADLDIQAVKAVLAARLPSYMLPNVYKVMDILPKNPNGKVDRNLLKTMARGAKV